MLLIIFERSRTAFRLRVSQSAAAELSRPREACIRVEYRKTMSPVGIFLNLSTHFLNLAFV